MLEEARGPDDPTVAIALNFLALLYDAQGRYEEAEPLFKRALVINETALGAKTLRWPQPSTIWRGSMSIRTAVRKQRPYITAR